ncbi:Hypothetical predicted protein [Paramuricea clavata]|uniref:Uncharacterized protein n=1 Tax=Paramuricea clavata TaxID=317549 RepID=A0A6S7FRG9_PARCT|nr:Hypothetical predicted protein [Paramuricea clavata]
MNLSEELLLLLLLFGFNLEPPSQRTYCDICGADDFDDCNEKAHGTLAGRAASTVCEICGVLKHLPCDGAKHYEWFTDAYEDDDDDDGIKLVSQYDDDDDDDLQGLTVLPDTNIPERKMFDDPKDVEEYVKTAYEHIFAEHKKLYDEESGPKKKCDF